MQPETKFKRKVQEDLKSLGSKVWFYKTQEVCTIGIPDIIICLLGKFMAIELKKDSRECSNAKKNRLSLQHRNVTLINEAGGYSDFTCPDCWDMVFKKLSRECQSHS